MLNHTGETHSHKGMMDYQRIPITEWNLGKFLTVEFQSWKVNFRTEVCLRTADPEITMLWIKEVEIAKSLDELVTSRSIDAMIASVLKKLLNTQSNFRKRASVEEQGAHKDDRFSRGRQIAYMIHEHFRVTGACEAVQGLSTLFAVVSQNDNVQDFDVKWDDALSTVSEMPSDMILEALYKSKVEDSVQFQTVIALYDQETARTKEPNYHKLKTAIKLHIDQTMRTRNFRVRSDVVKGDQSPRVNKERKPALRGKWKSVFSGKHMDNVPKETRVVSVMTSKPLETVAKIRDEKDERLLLHLKAKQTEGEGQKSSEGSGNKQENSFDKSEIPC